MAKIDISRYLKSKTLEELESLTMDVSKSFLNGCPCSPLAVTPDSGILSKALNSALSLTSSDTQQALSYVQESTAYGYKLYQDAMAGVDNIVTSLGGQGIYINKLGNKINIQTDFIPNAINIGLGIGQSVMECVTDEAKEIFNRAVTKIIQFPDPKYFTSYVTTYFGKWLNSDECKKMTADLINMGSSNLELDIPDYDEQKREMKDKHQSKMIENITYFCQNKVPEIGNWIDDKKQKIVEYTSMACSYAAFGKDWVCDAVDKYVNKEIEHIEDYVDLKVDKILHQKQNIIDMVAKEMTEQAVSYHKKLMNDAQKLISKETKLKIKNAELKAKMAVVSAAAKVCAKFGVPVPKFDDVISVIEKARLGEYTKKIANLVNMAGLVVGGAGKAQVTDGTVEQGQSNEEHPFYKDETTGKWMIWSESEQKYVESDTPLDNTPEPIKPTSVPTAEGQVDYGADGSRWTSYKRKVKIPVGLKEPKTDYEVEIYDWTLVATAEQEKERYGSNNNEERPLTDAERRLQEAQAAGLAETGVDMSAIGQNGAQGSAATDTGDPIQLLMATQGLDKKTATTKWQAAQKTARKMVSAHIRAARYAPGWGQLAKNSKLKKRVIDAQARIILKLPVTDTRALNIINGRG